jgi:carbonic anhydrase
MFDVIYRYDPTQPALRQAPGSADEARRHLEEGNREFATLLTAHGPGGPSGSRVIPFDLEDVGIAEPGRPPRQQPFAVVLGCSDARVPTELVFDRTCNELFVVRVAGHVLSEEVLGSIDYAVDHLGTGLRLLVVLGHSQCGAVTAAVDAFLKPSAYLALATSHHVRAIVNNLYPAVRAAALALTRTWGEDVERQPGYRDALVETSVVVNAALTAAVLQRDFADASSTGLRAVFGVYHLVTRRVYVPAAGPPADGDAVCLLEPPRRFEGFLELARQVATSDDVRRLLGK